MIARSSGGSLWRTPPRSAYDRACASAGRSARLGIICAARHCFKRGVLLAYGFDLGPHCFVSKGAERQPERRMFLFNSGDDRLGGPDRIAWLISTIALNLAATPDRRLGVGVDRFLRRLERSAGPVGAEGTRLDDDDLDPQWADLLGQRLGQALDGEFGRRVVAGAGKANEAAHRR